MSQTIDPTQIQSASQIPPVGALYAGLSSHGEVDVYCGTLSGDVDAQPAAQELLNTAPDTGGGANADYIYNQVSAIYGGPQLPSLQSPSGNNVKSLVFVSGSNQGGYGAFHIGDGSDQTDFDRIAVDSLTVSGNYSAGSGLGSGSAMEPIASRIPRIFGAFTGPGDLLEIVHADDPRLLGATPEMIRSAHGLAAQNILALQAALETKNTSAKVSVKAHAITPQGSTKEELVRHLIHANLEVSWLVRAVTTATSGRQYLSTALFAAEIIESFQTLTHKANPGKTDGEAVSRVVAFKLAPEIALVPGFNSGVTQQWWQDGHPDYVNDNSQSDQSTDGNAAGVMFLLFLTDYLGLPMDQIIQAMPATDGAPLGNTYTSLLQTQPQLSSQAGKDGTAAFQAMISLLQQNTQTANGTLALPADGNPFPNMPGAKSGGLFSQGEPQTPAPTRPAKAKAPSRKTKAPSKKAKVSSRKIKASSKKPPGRRR